MTNLDLKQKMEFILSVGQILAEYGAVTDKIIANTKKTAAFMGISEANFNMTVMPSVLLLNIFDGEKLNYSFKNYANRGFDMNIVNLICSFIDKAMEKNYPPQKFQAFLQKIINRKKIYSSRQNILVTGLFCGAFCILFGGDYFAAIYTAFCAAIGKFLQIKLLKFGVNHIITTAITAFAATSAAYFTHFLPTETAWCPIVACALFLIPGVPIINAITDSMNGFLLNSIAKLYNAFLTTLSLVIGIVFSTALCENVEEIDSSQLLILSNNNFAEILIAGIVVAISFSILLNIPKKFFIPLGILGAISLTAKNFMVFKLNFSPEIAIFFATTLIGVLSLKVKNFTRTPLQVLTFPAIISFVPGVWIYRFLFSCIYIRYMDVESFFYEFGFGIDAFQIILAMTVGVTLPSLIASKFLKE